MCSCGLETGDRATPALSVNCKSLELSGEIAHFEEGSAEIAPSYAKVFDEEVRAPAVAFDIAAGNKLSIRAQYTPDLGNCPLQTNLHSYDNSENHSTIGNEAIHDRW